MSSILTAHTHTLSDWLQNHVFVLSAILMLITALVSIRVLVVTKMKWHGAHFVSVTILALSYAVSYILFLTGVWTRLQWSEIMIYPSLFSIIVVWLFPILVGFSNGKITGQIPRDASFIPSSLKRLYEKITRISQ